jgi:sensor histidine kinase YesM
MWFDAEPFETWWFGLWELLRFALISGATTLCAMGIAEALLAAWPTRSSPWWWHVPAVALGAAAGLGLRAMASGTAGSEAIDLDHSAGQWLLWCVIGLLGGGIYRMDRMRSDARANLAASQLARQQLEAQVTEAHLAALQAQIEPHFLFNTLANVRRLYETDAAQGRTMLSSLNAYLEAALPSMRQAGSTVRREIELARAYLTILQMRMGARLKFHIDCDATVLDARLPPMMLPTLVENAVKHGLGPLPEGGCIMITIDADQESLHLSVSDDGAGFTQSGGSGIGLANIRARLLTLYGRESALTLAGNQPRGVCAGIRIPLMFEKAVNAGPVSAA